MFDRMNSERFNKMKRKFLMNDNFFRAFEATYPYNPFARLEEINRLHDLRSNVKGKCDVFICEIDGFKMVIDCNTRQDLEVYDGLLHKGYEPMTTRLLYENLGAGDVFVDAGANNGYFSLIASKLIGNKGKVLSFEPSPSTFQRLKHNLSLNISKNTEAFNVALSNEEGIATFYQFHFADGNNSFVKLPGTREITVNTNRLDKVLNGEMPTMIKIDVEGYERELLEGGKKSILENEQIKIIMEYNRRLLRKRKRDYDSVINLLREYDFRIWMIDDKQFRLSPEMVGDHKTIDPFNCNLFCKK